MSQWLYPGHLCSTSSTTSRPKNTKLSYYIASTTHIPIATSFSDATGILPVHYIHQSIDDVINWKCVVKEFVLGLLM
ncbi:MAG: hypothetical protein KA270_13915 [Saprospiraceae bacterium]|nr:hypothetical protein [Saprospiraceae bacterium]MBP6568262.1 hypothetical protein [Saprospiraceae bacterium]